MIFKQFQSVDGLKPVVKLPVPMAAKEISESFVIKQNDGDVIYGQPGDYLMQGMKGELYVCRKDVFEQCYKYLELPTEIHGVQQFRKKPVVVDAIQWTGENTFEVVTFIGGKKPNTSTYTASDKWDMYCDLVLEKGLTIRTLEDGPDGRAAHVASVGDFIVKGVAGEFHAVKPDIFAATYELVETPPTVEVQSDLSGFRFRLVKGDRHSHWADYNGICTLDGYAAVTGYFSGSGAQELVALPVAEVMSVIAAGEVK